MIVGNLITQTVLPRVVYLPYFCARVVLLFYETMIAVARMFRRPLVGESKICIEAGERGWESIEFKELYLSACEYLADHQVFRLIVSPNFSYVQQVRSFVADKKPTHYLYDPRTGSQKWLHGLWQSFMVLCVLKKHGVIPVVFLTDLSVRRWRAQSSVVSANSGLVISFISSRVVQPIFPHKRLVGPSVMPFSRSTRNKLDTLIKRRTPNNPRRAVFTGSLYDPREGILDEVKRGVEAKGAIFESRGRKLGTPRKSDLEYWSILVNADIVFTTSVQIVQAGRDWSHIPHLVYRYIEAMAAGSLLVAQEVPGIRRYFNPGEHFVSFSSCEEAVEKIVDLLGDENARTAIARNGKKRADALINAGVFWQTIDAALGTAAIH